MPPRRNSAQSIRPVHPTNTSIALAYGSHTQKVIGFRCTRWSAFVIGCARTWSVNRRAHL